MVWPGGRYPFLMLPVNWLDSLIRCRSATAVTTMSISVMADIIQARSSTNRNSQIEELTTAIAAKNANCAGNSSRDSCTTRVAAAMAIAIKCTVSQTRTIPVDDGATQLSLEFHSHRGVTCLARNSIPERIELGDQAGRSAIIVPFGVEKRGWPDELGISV